MFDRRDPILRGHSGQYRHRGRQKEDCDALRRSEEELQLFDKDDQRVRPFSESVFGKAALHRCGLYINEAYERITGVRTRSAG
jgi:hypothetical protein